MFLQRYDEHMACKETDDIQINDPGAEDCRRQLNNCLDQVEDRIAGISDYVRNRDFAKRING
ncbi:UNVERIFIED_CONTAM: hypothetical protein NCL1_23858 [Trichonephila clavipes]